MSTQSVADLDVGALSAITPMALLDCMSTPVFLLRSDGFIVHSNAAGSDLLRNNRVIRAAGPLLIVYRPSDTKALTGIMATVAKQESAQSLALTSDDGTSTLLLTIAPVPGNDLLVVFAVSLQPSGPNFQDFLKAAFGLSPQSTQLAESLMYGLSLAEFSSKTGVTLGATRTRLKKLFARTGTRSQAMLVSVLWRAATIATKACGPDAVAAGR